MEQIFVKTRFYLHSPKSTYSQIEMRIRHKGEIIRIIIKNIKVKTSQWSQNEQKAIISNIQNNIDNHNNKIANKAIAEYQTKFEEYVNNIIANNLVILPTEIKKHFNINTMGRKPLHKQNKVDIFEEMRRICRDNIKNLDVFKNYSEKGIPLLKMYLDTKGIEITDYHQFTSDLFWDMARWVDKDYHRIVNKRIAVSTANTIVKYAICAVKKASECGGFLTMAERNQIRQKELPNHSGKFNEIFLRNEEILKLWKYKPEKKRDEVVRDIFLIECLTGQRISDTQRISNNLTKHNDRNYIELHTQKSQTTISVDFVFKLAKEIIIDKYNGEIPYESKDYINKRIKEIALKAGINGVHSTVIHYCGNDKATKTEHQRYSLIATHTGRRTFISQLILRGWNYETIAKYSGHEKIDTVKKYDKISQKEKDIYRQEKEHLELLEHHQTLPQQQLTYQPQQENITAQTKEQIIKEYEEQKAKEKEIKNELDIAERRLLKEKLENANNKRLINYIINNKDVKTIEEAQDAINKAGEDYTRKVREEYKRKKREQLKNDN